MLFGNKKTKENNLKLKIKNSKLITLSYLLFAQTFVPCIVPTYTTK